MAKDDFWLSRVKESASLSQVDRTAEILFGLIMVLTFTGAISVATGGRQEVRELLWAALGCNLAWGLVDAIMYLMNIVIERAHATTILRKITATSDADAAREILKGELPPFMNALMKNIEVDQVIERLKQVPAPSTKIILTVKDWLVGLQIFFLVFLCTLPVALPFGIFKDVQIALRASNGVALILLFIAGFRLARYAGLRPGVTAIIYTLIGVALVSLTMALGG